MKKRNKPRRVSASRNGKAKRANQPVRLTIGRAGFEKVSAIEGLYLTSDMKAAFGQLDRKGASPSQRRAAIIRRYG